MNQELGSREAVGVELPPTPDVCLSCGAVQLGRFCYECGQRSHAELPTLQAFIVSGVTSAVDLDGPIWQSLRKLVVSPGTLSVEFLAGRGRSNVHPARFFILVAVTAFALSTLVLNDLERGGIVYIATVGLASLVNERWGQLLILLVAVPTMAAALKVLFLRTQRKYLEHLVVSIEFFTLLLLAGTVETLLVILADLAVGVSIQLAGGLVTAVGLTLAGGVILRKAYRVSLLDAAVGVLFLYVAAGTVVAFSIELIDG